MDWRRPWSRTTWLSAFDGGRKSPGFHGFDAFMRWYVDPQQVLGPTTHRVEDLLTSPHIVAAVLVIADDASEWTQVAIYSLTGGSIEHIRVFEDPWQGGKYRQ